MVAAVVVGRIDPAAKDNDAILSAGMYPVPVNVPCPGNLPGNVPGNVPVEIKNDKVGMDGMDGMDGMGGTE